MGNRIIGKAATCACIEPENAKVSVDEDFLNAVVLVGGLLPSCRSGFMVKGAEDSSLVAVLSTECVEDHGAFPAGLCVPTGMG